MAVPFLPGVPPLASFSSQTFTFLTGDTITSSGNNETWAVLLNGNKAFPYKSVVSLGLKKDPVQATYPVEGGDFQDYDKVIMPFDMRLKLSSEGTLQGRRALWQALKAAIDDLNMYDIVMPEDTLSNMNISHVDFERAATNNLGMLIIDVWFKEIRPTGSSTAAASTAGAGSTTSVSSPQQPQEASPVGNGNVQAQDAPATFAQRFDAGTWQLQ